MSDFKTDTNSNILHNATKKLRLRFPVADIVKKTGYAKGGVSDFLNGKKPVSDEFLKKFSEAYKIDLSDFKDVESELTENPTGYYYPEVSASAGLENKLHNDELNRIPINIPNWGKDLDFINVFGDSMYPKYCAGEIIGIKEIDAQMLHFGYAYVVIMQDGEVYLKYITAGIDNDHFLLSSENPKNPPREYHLSLIRKIFIVKGVLTKTTM